MIIQLDNTVQSWGKKGEHNATMLTYDMKEYIQTNPGGECRAVYTRADNIKYVIPIVMKSSIVTVELTRTETAVVGRCRIEFIWDTDDSRSITAGTFSGTIAYSDVASCVPPDPPGQATLEQVIDAQKRACACADKAEAASVNTPKIYNGTWWTWSFEAGKYEDTKVKAQGPKGDIGISPHVGQNGNWFVGDVDTGIKARGPKGDNGITPNIGYNGNWFVGKEDTQVPAQGPKGDVGLTPHVGSNGNWFVGNEDTGLKAQGTTPHIGSNKHWFVGTHDTGIVAEGKDGANGITPHIGQNGNWFVGKVDTGVDASGIDGVTPHIGSNKHWFVGTHDTGIVAEGKDGITPHIGSNGNWFVGDMNTDVPARGPQGNMGEPGKPPVIYEGTWWVWSLEKKQYVNTGVNAQGVSIKNIIGNADGSWTITYTDGSSETVSNEAYNALVTELQRAKHTTMAVEITDDGFGGYNSSANDNDINNHRNAGGVVFCYYHDSASDVTYTYWYSNMEPDRKPTFLRTYIDDKNAVKQVLISIDNAKKATVKFRTASVPIDPTLTQPNQAADAKAVGDALDSKLDKDGEYELVEVVAPGYECLSEKPIDWDTNREKYFIVWMSNLIRPCRNNETWKEKRIFRKIEYAPVKHVVRTFPFAKSTVFWIIPEKHSTYSLHFTSIADTDERIDISIYPKDSPGTIYTQSYFAVENGRSKVNVVSGATLSSFEQFSFPQEEKFKPLHSYMSLDFWKYANDPTETDIKEGEIITIYAIRTKE